MQKFTQVDISQSILRHFGAERGPSELIPDNSHAIVLWIVDGFGLSHWREAVNRGLMPHTAPHITNVIPGDSIYPTTTAAGLASYAFAAPPAVHGALGYWIYLSEINRPINMLTGRDENGEAAPPDILYPAMPTIFSHLAEKGISSAVVSPSLYETSLLSRWLYSDATYVPYPVKSPLEAVNCVRDSLAAGCRFIWLYWPYIDASAHRTGLVSPRTDYAVSQFDSAYGLAIEQWQFPKKTTIIISADHGMVPLSLSHAIPKTEPRIANLWASQWAGERRAITTELAADAVREQLGDLATIYSQDEIWEQGWYGGPPARPTWRQRVLNTLILAHPLSQFEQDPLRDTPFMEAAHGARTQEEKEIPISVQTL